VPTPSTSDSVLVAVADGVATVTLNRPEARNALNGEVRAVVPALLAELGARDDVAAIVLTGADPAFCAGLDLRELSGETAGAVDVASLVVTDRGPFAAMGTPIIGAINGAAITGGLEYALACDFLIASERARFADTHTRVGIMPGWGLTVRLAEAVGVRRAKHMSATGNFVDAPTALAWGLVNLVVPHGELLATAQQIGRDIASILKANVSELMSIYNEQEFTLRAQQWGIESERSLAWLSKSFDRGALAGARQGIQERGRAQV